MEMNLFIYLFVYKFLCLWWQLAAGGFFLFGLSVQYVIQAPLGGVDPLTSDNTPVIWTQTRPPLAGYIIPKVAKVVKCTKFGQFILEKIIKIVATRCQILRLKCTKLFVGWGSAPDPAGGAYSECSPRPPSWILGAYF